jgi:hypothetical protein
MNNRLLKIHVALFLIFFSMIGCKKSSVHIKTNTELLTQSAWYFDNAKVGGTDVSPLLPTCQKDNILTFASNGTGILDEGPTKCNASDPQQTPFTWSFLSSETILHVSTVLFTGGSSDFNIVTLTETQFVISQNITVSGTTQNAVITLKH